MNAENDPAHDLEEQEITSSLENLDESFDFKHTADLICFS